MSVGVEDEREAVLMHRERFLLGLDFSPQQARQLARDQVDLHEAKQLRRQGCPAEIAYEILRD